MRAIVGISFFLGFVLFLSYSFEAFGIPFPPAITGLIVLFLWLCTQKKAPQFLEEGAAMLFRFFPLLFVPPLTQVAGVMDSVYANLAVLLFATTVSSLFGLWVTAKLYLWLRRRQAS